MCNVIRNDPTLSGMPIAVGQVEDAIANLAHAT
jgi:hypothetical protein